jgi:hypothetical protein
MQRDLARAGDPLVVDSRLGWYFFTDAFKVHLKADPAVAARRAMERQAGRAESYRTLDEARQRLDERSESERARFLTTYGVDKARLRNYSLVCDTSHASPDEIVDAIMTTYDRDVHRLDRPVLFLDPARVLLPSKDGTEERASWPLPAGTDRHGSANDAVDGVAVGYAHATFFALAHDDQVRVALDRGEHLIRARLVAEGDERLPTGATAEAYAAALPG